MRPLLATLAALTLLALLPAPASAQQQGAMVVMLNAPDGTLSEDRDVLVLTGTATLTTDITAYTSTTGIPVQYSISESPAWASVLVSPASDVFVLPAVPSGFAVTMTRTFTVTIALGDAPAESVIGLVEVAATTTPGLLGVSFTGKGAAGVSYVAPEVEPCDLHADMTKAEWAELAVEAADAYNAHQAETASAERSGSEEVSVQTGGSSLLRTPTLVVAAFALIGAGVGLVLRRRFVR